MLLFKALTTVDRTILRRSKRDRGTGPAFRTHHSSVHCLQAIGPTASTPLGSIREVLRSVELLFSGCEYEINSTTGACQVDVREMHRALSEPLGEECSM
jgi:hypothetical protein